MGRMKNLLAVLLAVLLLVAGAGNAGAAKLVVDRNHGQVVDLSGLTSALGQGWTVVELREPLTDQALSECSLLVLPQPVSGLAATEVAAIVAYVRGGGGLLVLGEAGGTELIALQDVFGIKVNSDTVSNFGQYYGAAEFPVLLLGNQDYDSSCDPIPFYNPSYGNIFRPILDGVTSFVYSGNGGCSLTVDQSKVGFVVTGSCEEYSDSEPVYPPLIAATTLDGGRAVFLGDTDALAANQQLLTNIVNWLKKPEPAPPEEPETTEVTINLRPWNPNNHISLNARGFIRVAILSDPESNFDAANVDPKSVVFAGASPVCWKLQKVNRDPQEDLVLVFWIPDLNDLTCESNEAVLTGTTKDGTSIYGSDGVQIVPTGKCKKPPKNEKCGGKKGK